MPPISGGTRQKEKENVIISPTDVNYQTVLSSLRRRASLYLKTKTKGIGQSEENGKSEEFLIIGQRVRKQLRVRVQG